jgi:hypothetical protein
VGLITQASILCRPFETDGAHITIAKTIDPCVLFTEPHAS